MQAPSKLVVIVFPNGFQGQVWATILRSQNLSVIWECPDVPLTRTLKLLHRQKMTPDLLIVDTRLRHLSPYHLCRWQRVHCPETILLLVNGAQSQILASERQWAIAQGAADLLPAFQRTAPISSATQNLAKALDLMCHKPVQHPAMVAALLNLGLFSRRSNCVRRNLEQPSAASPS